MSRYTLWTYNMVYFITFFYSYEEKYRSKATAKKHTKAYYIICSLYRSTHLESNTIGFSILWFFCDLLWFFKTALGANLTGFEKFRGWYRPFHSLGGYVVHPHRWGDDIDFFLIIILKWVQWMGKFSSLHLYIRSIKVTPDIILKSICK